MAIALLSLFHYALLLLFGVLLSFAFAGVEPSRKNAAALLAISAKCGALQLASAIAFGEQFVWLAYPLLTHLPVVLLLCLKYRKRTVTSLAAVATAYLCCQPANWAGILVEALTANKILDEIAQIVTLALVAYVILRYAHESLATLFAKDVRSVFIFGCVPFVYYLFDYSMSVYSDNWGSLTGPVVEFLPCFICLAFVAFCVAYHQAYEQKLESERREQIVSIMVEQQRRELEAVRRSEDEMRRLRHDLRMLLNNLLQCLNEEDDATARKLLAGYLDDIEKTVIIRFCESEIVNYIVSAFCERCERAGIRFEPAVEMAKTELDETLLASLLSNALDNAFNAQEGLEPDDRLIALSIKTAKGKLMLRLENAYAARPEFVDGMPVSRREGHGFGSQSIRYMTERLGGDCKFSLEDDRFVLRVIIEL